MLKASILPFFIIYFEFGLFPLLLSPTGDRIDTST